MSQDLFLKKTNRNYARGGSSRPAQRKLLLSINDKSAKPVALAAKQPKLFTSLSNPSKPNPFKSDFLWGAFIGDEERELARYGGSSERDALLRRTSLHGESIRDADLEDDDDENQQTGSRGKAQKTAGTTSEAITKTATSASQMRAVTAAASQLSRLAKRRR
jgi:hypothetical protein